MGAVGPAIEGVQVRHRWLRKKRRGRVKNGSRSRIPDIEKRERDTRVGKKKKRKKKKISTSPLYTMKILKSLFVTFPWILIVLDDFFPPLSKFKLFLDYSRFSLELRNLWKTFRCLGKFNVQVRSLVYQLYRFREIIFFRNNFHYRTTSFDRWFKRRSFFFLSFFSKNIIYSYYTRIIATSWNKMTQARANLRVIFERRSWIHVSRRERGTASGR